MKRYRSRPTIASLLLPSLVMILGILLIGCTSPQPAEVEETPEAEVEESSEVEAEEAAETEEPSEAEAEEETEAGEPEAVADLTEDRLIPEIRFVIPGANYDPIRFESGQLIADEWEKLGLSVNVEAFGDFTALAAVLGEAPHDDFNAFISGYVSRPERLDPDVLLYRPFHCSGVETGVNYQGYCHPEYDEVVEAQRSEMDVEERRQLVYEAQEMLAQDVPAQALYHVEELHAYNSRLFDNVTPMMGQGLWNFWSLLSTTPIADVTTLRVGQAWDVDTLNPFAPTGGGNIETMRLIHDMLARVAPDGTAVPWAAESWEVVDDTTVAVTLRDDMTFHDGEPVTATDVKFSYDIQKEQGAEIYIPFLDPIEEVELVDEYNLVFHLEVPYPGIFQATFAQILIVPEHIWGEVDGPLAEHQVETLIGSGPFIFDEWIVGQEVRLQAFEDHFQAPNVDGLTQVVYANPDAIFLGLVNEEVHMHDRRLLPIQIEQLDQYEHLTQVSQEDFGVYYVGYNLRLPPFDDDAFRRALAHTIPKQTIVDVLLDGYGVAGRGFIAPANEFWHNPDANPFPYDPDLARQILEEAGYEWGPDGRLYMPAE
jgi:peptide/nickel transport system substrate-binding protein